MPKINCCKDCEERYPACHDTCQRYQAEKKADLDARMRYKEKNLGNTQLHQIASDRFAKRLKKK